MTKFIDYALAEIQADPEIEKVIVWDINLASTLLARQQTLDLNFLGYRINPEIGDVITSNNIDSYSLENTELVREFFKYTSPEHRNQAKKLALQTAIYYSKKTLPSKTAVKYTESEKTGWLGMGRKLNSVNKVLPTLVDYRAAEVTDVLDRTLGTVFKNNSNYNLTSWAGVFGNSSSSTSLIDSLDNSGFASRVKGEEGRSYRIPVILFYHPRGKNIIPARKYNHKVAFIGDGTLAIN